MRFFFLIFLAPTLLWSQKMSLRLENDHFLFGQQTDKYNTFSGQVSYHTVAPIHQKTLKLFPVRSGEKSYEWALKAEMLTPSDLTPSDEYYDIWYNIDRPFVGLVYVQLVQQNWDKNSHRASEIRYKIGLLGEGTQMEALQQWLHERRGYDMPQWKKQMPNLPLFQAEVQEGLKSVGDFSTLSIFGEMQGGTLGWNVALGGKMELGNPKKGFYIFAEPKLKYVLQDATIQGNQLMAIFHKAYWEELQAHFPASSIENVVKSLHYGIQYSGKFSQVSYQQLVRSKDIKFNAGMTWGIVEVAFKL